MRLDFSFHNLLGKRWSDNATNSTHTSSSNTKLSVFFVTDDALPLSQHCMKPCSKKTLTKEEILFIYHLSRNRFVNENMFGLWINRFSIFATRAATLAPDIGSVVVMVFALHNLLRSKSRDSYTLKGSDDKIQSNRSLLQGDKSFVKQHNWSGESICRKMKLKYWKKWNIITGVCHWTRTSLLVFKDSNRMTVSRRGFLENLKRYWSTIHKSITWKRSDL